MKKKITVMLDGEKITFRPYEEFRKELYPTKKLMAAADARYQRFSFGYDILVARKKRHLTQASLAKRMKTTQSVIARIERGDQNVTLDTIQQIAKALNQPITIKP